MAECELCHPDKSRVLWQNEHFYLLDAGSERFPAYIRVVSQRHVAEMTDLPPEEREELRAILDACEELMRDLLHPDKVNWAQFGNMVPHLHWHMTARWHDDEVFPDNPWGKPVREVSEMLCKERRERAVLFLQRLPDRLDRLMRERT